MSSTRNRRGTIVIEVKLIVSELEAEDILVNVGSYDSISVGLAQCLTERPWIISQWTGFSIYLNPLIL